MKLSVIVIGKNCAAYLPRSIGSVVKQKTDEVEVVYVDDASTDTSVAIAECVCGKDARIVRNETSRGPGGARNAGVAATSGDYLWLIDGDDYVTEGGVARVLSAIGDTRPDVVVMPFRVLKQGGQYQDTTTDGVTNLDTLPGWPISQSLSIIRRDLYVPQPEGEYGEDSAWHFLQFDKFGSFAKVEGKEPVYVWDCTVPGATTRTVEWFAVNAATLEALAMSDMLVKGGLKDRYVSDCLRNLAALYDVRHKLTRPAVKAAWANKFRSCVSRMLMGHMGH